MSRSVLYTSSPLLASKTPVWRSKFIVAVIGLGFLGLVGRAAYVQVFGNAFFQRQGEVRFARTLELPANRGKIVDRNGLILASSVPAASIWAIPEDVDQDKPEVRAKLKQLAKLLDMPQADLLKKLADEDKTGMWASRLRPWTSRASTSARNTSASTPRARPQHTWWALPMWKTMARKAWSWRSTRSWRANLDRAA